MLCWLGEDGSTFDNSQLQAEVAAGTAKPFYAIGIEATQPIGAPSISNRIAFRDDLGIQQAHLALMSAMGYAGPYVKFSAAND